MIEHVRMEFSQQTPMRALTTQHENMVVFPRGAGTEVDISLVP